MARSRSRCCRPPARVDPRPGAPSRPSRTVDQETGMQPAPSRRTAHLYIYEGWADWEPAFTTAGLNTPDYQCGPGHWRVVTVGPGRNTMLHSAGGITALPDLALDDLVPESSD